jgi:YD repeat-containing protein
VASASTGGTVSYVFYDVLGREIQRTKQGYNGQTVVVDITYNAIGKVASKSKPHYAGTTDPSVTFSDRTQIEYDAIGRPWRTNRYDANGNVISDTVTYNGLTTSTDRMFYDDTNTENIQTRSETKDVAGHLVAVNDIGGKTISYEYDALGNVRFVRQSDGKVVETQYDLVGRKVVNIDPDAGEYHYSYNALGQLTSENNPVGRAANKPDTSFQYDLLGRLIQRKEPDLTSTWVYDKPADAHCGNGNVDSGAGTANGGWIGALCYAKTDNGWRRDMHYDKLGRTAEVDTTVDSVSTPYAVKNEFDGAGRLIASTYPNVANPAGTRLHHVYDARGWLTDIYAAGKPIWHAQGNDAYDANGRLRHEKYGNGALTDTDYDVNTDFMSAISATGPTGNGISQQTFTIDGIGRLQMRTDATTSLSDSFGYDDFNRLNHSVSSVDGTVDLSYADNGNILTKSDVGNYSYNDAKHPHAVTGITGASNHAYYYDMNGNLTSRDGAIQNWTSYNQPCAGERQRPQDHHPQSATRSGSRLPTGDRSERHHHYRQAVCQRRWPQHRPDQQRRGQ